MVSFEDEAQEGHELREPPDGRMYASAPEDGYEPHPLFPREDGSPETRDIQFVAFRRRRSDGSIDNTAEDLPAGDVQSWADVVSPWGGGEYKALGKDKNHRVVAWFPETKGDWMLFDLESKPFTLLGKRYRHSPPIAAPAAAPAPAPAPAVAAAPPAPPAPTPSDPVLIEVLRELRELRAARVPAPVPASAPVANDTAMVEMIKSQGEMMRTVLSAVLTPRPAEATPKSNNDPMAMALQILGAIRSESTSKPTSDPMATALQILGAFQKFAPPQQLQHQGSVTDRLGEYRAIRELATPTAPPPPQSEFGEIKDLLMSVVQADALSKSTRDVTMPPPLPERRPPPVPERRPPPPPPPPPPPRAPLQHVPGLGMVRVEQPEAPPRRTDDRDVDFELLQRDPNQRQRMLKALGLDKPVASAIEIVVPPPEAPVSAPSSVHAAVAPTPEGSLAAAAVERIDLVDTAFDPPPQQEVSPEVTPPPIDMPAAPSDADDRIPIALPEEMPIAEPHVATEAERERAQGVIPGLLRLPREQLRIALCKVPGVGANVDDLISALRDMPPTAWPIIMSKLPADVVQALGGLGG